MMNKTLSVCITGSIGCGKSLMGKVFTHLGIPVFCADDEAKALYKQPEIQESVKEMFGETIFKDNVLQAKILSEIVFNDKNKLKQLNSFLHPKVQQQYKDFLSYYTKKEKPYVIMESAIVFEIEWENLFDKIICVDTPQELTILRAMERDKVSREQILQRLSNQKPMEYKRSHSDYIINNDNVELVLPQILKIDQELKTISYNKQ